MALTGCCGTDCRYANLVDPCYPQRYEAVAHHEVNEAMAPQMMNGHVLDQALWDDHFEAGTDKLTPGGIEHLKYLARRRPHADPVIFLEAAQDVPYDPARPDAYVRARAELTDKRPRRSRSSSAPTRQVRRRASTWWSTTPRALGQSSVGVARSVLLSTTRTRRLPTGGGGSRGGSSGGSVSGGGGVSSGGTAGGAALSVCSRRSGMQSLLYVGAHCRKAGFACCICGRRAGLSACPRPLMSAQAPRTRTMNTTDRPSRRPRPFLLALFRRFPRPPAPPAFVRVPLRHSQQLGPIEWALGSQQRMLQVGTVGMCLAMYIIMWRK